MDKTMAATSERIELVTPLGEELLFHGMVARDDKAVPHAPPSGG